jgi:hypothetical protein
LVPSADLVYGCDEHWWPYHLEALKNTKAELWTQCEKAAKKYNLNRIEGVSSPGLGRKIIHFGGNSGYQAINLAFLFGATKMILLGFDMKKDGDKVHFFGNHPYHNRPNEGPNDGTMRRWVNNFTALAADLKQERVEVINATRNTALTCFTRQPLEEIR